MRTFLPLLVLFALCFACGTPTVSTGGDPRYGDLLIKAAAAEEEGRFLEAARHYHSAYELRPERAEHIHQAAELYTRARDYESAAFAYSLVPADDDRWPLLGLRYGRALKQSGEAERAERVLIDFQAGYNGTDRQIVSDLVGKEIEGLALSRKPPDNSRYIITRLGAGVNSGGDETGAALIGTNRLLFATARGDQRSVLESRLEGSEWQRATPPGGFPLISGGRFGTGAFSDDGRTFFFTICSGIANGRCEIYRSGLRLSGGWNTPERLGEIVNAPGANNAFPSAVALEDGRQVLYFASTRSGGLGGFDVYRATQAAANDPLTFGDLQLLGPAVNTFGDEITPVFDRGRQQLTFASNGHPGLGGYDLFRADRRDVRYDAAVNLGPPINTPADDYGLTPESGNGLAVLSSNRPHPGKPGTTDDDLYQLTEGVSTPILRATAFDAEARTALPGVEVTLLEIDRNKQEREVERSTFANSTYQLPLRSGTTYRVVLRRPGYERAEYRVVTDAEGSAVYGRPVYLRSNGTAPAGRAEPGGAGGPPNSAPGDPDFAPASAPPVAFRIQISAARNFDPADAAYDRVKVIGDVRSEAVPGRNLRRVTVGYYPDLERAKAALQQVREAGFPEAFVVRYDNGTRYGPIW